MTSRVVGSSPPLNSADYNAQRRSHSRESGSGSDDGRRQSNTLSDQYPTDPHEYPKDARAWQHRPHSPGLKWHRKYTDDDLTCSRVLIIDYVKSDYSKKGMRKVAAQELYSVDALRKFYNNPARGNEAVLRVIHVQNAHWATRWLIKKFNIKDQDSLVGTDFGKYVMYRNVERRGGKPFLSGKTWGIQHDPWRGISKTSFGLDYLKEYRAVDPLTHRCGDIGDKMMELNGWDEQDNPAYGFDVFVQRLSVYIQHKEVSPEIPMDPAIENPYKRAKESTTKDAKGRTGSYIPQVENLDNGNAILIFENSHTESIEDTIIEARQDLESRWRRLPFYLAYESRDVSNDDKMAVQCMKIILQDIFKGLVMKWDSFLDVAINHVSILEDKIYEQPADETRAPELWTNSSNWLKIEKLMFIHIDIVKDMRSRLHELTEDVDPEGDDWLEDTPSDFTRLSNWVEEDLTKPTSALSSLMYQSVSIRDSRHSLQLGLSMWRLSWITFIFLPLTFIVGFFGMNVDAFASMPSIKWYFIAAVPFMLLVLIAWFVMKTFLARQRQTPYQRGIWEGFFHDMAISNPSLWSRSGPRDHVLPSGRLARLKWQLIKWWASPDKTLRTANPESAVPDDLGYWSRLKKLLIRRWTAQIKANYPQNPSSPPDDDEELGLMGEALGDATQMAVLPAAPDVAEHMPGGMLEIPGNPQVRLERRIQDRRRQSPSAGGKSSSPSDGRSSGFIVEEEDAKWLSERGREGKGWNWKKDGKRRSDERSREREERKRRSGGEGSQTRSSPLVQVTNHEQSEAIMGQRDGFERPGSQWQREDEIIGLGLEREMDREMERERERERGRREKENVKGGRGSDASEGAGERPEKSDDEGDSHGV